MRGNLFGFLFLLAWLVSISNVSLVSSLIVSHKFVGGVQEFSYQTFSGVAMYSSNDAPSTSKPGNGESYISFDLKVKRSESSQDGSIELIVIPDININDIGFKQDNELHLCCINNLIEKLHCKPNKLIVSKNIPYFTFPINFNAEEQEVPVKARYGVKMTAIHVFAMASCSENLGTVTFEGSSVWMNPYGHLPGDVYGYLPFYGWMCIIYLFISVIWFIFNLLYWNKLLAVQNCITGVLAMLLIEMATWYFHYLHLNKKGIIHHGPFIFGLILTVTRRSISRMLVVSVSLGYGLIKPTLVKSLRNKIIFLGCIYWIFSFMFESLIHYNQTEKIDTWMRVVLIPPVAIINGIFWWWTFVSLNKTIEMLKIRKQSAKLQLYKNFTLILIAALLIAIIFAIYEMYYVLKELYFAEWERLWFMEVGFWQILFSLIFITIMVLWRPSEHFKRYAYMIELQSSEDDAEEYDDHLPKPDSFLDDDNNANNYNDDDDQQTPSDEDGGNNQTNQTTTKRKSKKTNNTKFQIIDENDDEHNNDDDEQIHNKPKTTLEATLEIIDGNDEDQKLAAQKMQ